VEADGREAEQGSQSNSPAGLTMVELARRHGPFDSRYPLRRKRAATTWELEPDEDRFDRLDWSAFLARFFPNSRRHDFGPLAAYESYINALAQASAAAAPLTGPVSGLAPLSDAVLVWEWEGGAVTDQVAG
jgi:hypothetical protein